MKLVLPANFWGLHKAPRKVRNPCHANSIHHILRRLCCPSPSLPLCLPQPQCSITAGGICGVHGSTSHRATEEKQAHLPCLEWSPNLKGNSISRSPDSQANYQIGWKGERCKALQTATDFLTVFFHISSLGWSGGGQYEVGGGRLHFELS